MLKRYFNWPFPASSNLFSGFNKHQWDFLQLLHVKNTHLIRLSFSPPITPWPGLQNKITVKDLQGRLIDLKVAFFVHVHKTLQEPVSQTNYIVA